MLSGAILAVFVAASSATPLSLEDFARNSMTEGRPNRIPGPLAKLLELPPEVPIHLLKVPAADTTDKMTHLAHVMVELSTGMPPAPIRPTGIVLNSHYEAGGKSIGYLYRATLAGELERAVLIKGKRDAQGGVVRGAGSATQLDVASPDVQKRFQHELDFWLKGAYRRKGKRNKPGP